MDSRGICAEERAPAYGCRPVQQHVITRHRVGVHLAQCSKHHLPSPSTCPFPSLLSLPLLFFFSFINVFFFLFEIEFLEELHKDASVLHSSRGSDDFRGAKDQRHFGTLSNHCRSNCMQMLSHLLFPLLSDIFSPPPPLPVLSPLHS